MSKTHGSFCSCGAWLGSLGLEPTPELYIEHLVEVFRHVRRVLRDDGTLWINLGDSYAGSGKGKPGKDGYQSPASQVDHVKYPDLANGLHDGYHKTVDYEARPRWPTYAKPKDLMMMPARVAMALQADGWYLRSMIPWLKRNCLSGGTRVYVRSQKGDMPMTVKDMARLDATTLKVWNGEKWTQLTGMWEEPLRDGDEIEIELRSGERINCTPEHRWPTNRGVLRTFELVVGDVMQGAVLPPPTIDRLAMPSARHPVGLDDSDVGWFVGLYIAEGSMSGGTIQIASHARETARFERLSRIADAYDGTCRAHLKGANGMTINMTGPVLRGIIEQYVAGRVAKDKHLNNRCWMRSNEFVRAVLEGYLSGDGHYDEKNARWRLAFTRNYALEGDLRAMCARLGLLLRLKLATIRYAGRDVPIFRGSLRMGTVPLRVKNEFEILRIGRSRGRKFWDIAVEDDPHTFSLASGVLTHNSMPESVTDRPSTSVEYVFLLSKSARYFWDAAAVRQLALPGSISRYAYAGSDGRINSNGASKAAADGADSGMGGRERMKNPQVPTDGGRNRRNSDWFFESWQGLMLDEQDDPLALVVNPQPFSGAHFATFPPKLVEPMVKASSRPGDTILDPFCGAGSTLLVADRLGRNAIGCELKESYAEMGTDRIVGDAPLFTEISA